MAISVISYDNSIGHLADNKIVATSSNVSQNGFKYVVDVYVQGLSFWGQSYLRFFVPAKPITGRLEFNISDVLRDIADIKVLNESATAYCYLNDGNAGKIITTKIGEAYFTSSTNYSIFPNLATINQRVWMFSYFNYLDRSQLNPMYDIPTNIFRDRRIIRKWFNLPFNKTWFIKPITQSEISNNESRYEIQIIGSGVFIFDNVSASKPMIITPISEPLLGIYSIGTVTDTIADGVYDKINVLNANEIKIRFHTLPVFEYTFKVINKCREDGAIIYWLNRYGQIEHYYFDVFKRKINTITSDYIIRKDLDYLNYQGRYYGLENETITFTTTNIVDEQDAEGLRDLLTSKYVWYQ